jgi:diaminobutyrate-2-oxoglutarate transaminase
MSPMSAGTPSVFDLHESAVRTYCRSFPARFARAQGHQLWDAAGRCYTDFICGAGSLNYGHNHPLIKRRLIEYLEADGIIHGLDFHTSAKAQYIEDVVEVMFRPRGLDYKIQFTGPTGTNSVEAAFKLARKITGRPTILAFTNGFHGMTLGALAATGSARKRAGAGVPLVGVTRMPYDGYLGESVDTLALLETMIDDGSSGVDLPAAIIVETVQGEGGMKVAGDAWLRRLASFARARGILLILDDIQAGCGRTGTFFSFEPSGIVPDMICLSKSLSGVGLPMAVMLHRPELDQQAPGEHSGTFRGNNLAFVGASAALSLWKDPAFEAGIHARGAVLDEWIAGICARHAGAGCAPRGRGRGMMRGIWFADPAVAKRASAAAFEMGVLVETSGADGEVLKILPPLTIEVDAMRGGLATVARAIHQALDP